MGRARDEGREVLSDDPRAVLFGERRMETKYKKVKDGHRIRFGVRKPCGVVCI